MATTTSSPSVRNGGPGAPGLDDAGCVKRIRPKIKLGGPRSPCVQKRPP